MRKAALHVLFILFALAFLPAETKLQTIFSDHNVDGSIVIYDLNKDQWTFSDSDDANRGTIPASTFKICNSLIALEEKAIAPDTIISWDGKDKTFKGNVVKSWNADTNLESAFKNSTIWFYAELSKRIKRSTYARYLNKCGYGNLNLGEKGDDFWNYGNMEISPKNQVEFLAKLYKEELPFDKKNMALVKSYMRMNTDGTYGLSGKSGWGVKNGADIGWLIGFLETHGEAYVYATRITADSNKIPNDFGKLRAEITLEAFRQLGIIR
jgi:beta-lactamase class D